MGYHHHRQALSLEAVADIKKGVARLELWGDASRVEIMRMEMRPHEAADEAVERISKEFGRLLKAALTSPAQHSEMR